MVASSTFHLLGRFFTYLHLALALVALFRVAPLGIRYNISLVQEERHAGERVHAARWTCPRGPARTYAARCKGTPTKAPAPAAPPPAERSTEVCGQLVVATC